MQAKFKLKTAIDLKKETHTSVNSNLVTPKLVKLQKKGGKILYPYDVYIGRTINNPNWHLKDSIWHNPYRITSTQTRDDVIRLYEEYLLTKPELLIQLPNLSGCTLGCWCSPEPCHGNVIIKLFIQRIWEKIDYKSI